MEEHFFGTTDLGNLVNWLHHTDFVVHVDHRANQRVRSNCFLNISNIHNPILAHRQVSHFKPLIFQVAAAVKDAFVLDLGCDDVLLFLPVERSETLEA